MSGRWFGPRDFCGCCEPVPTCQCRDDISILSRGFVNTPTIKLEVYNAIDTVSFRVARFRFILNNRVFYFIDDYTIENIQSSEGTYFLQIPKTEQNCIDEFLNFSDTTSVGSWLATRVATPYDFPIGGTVCQNPGTPTTETKTISPAFSILSQWQFFTNARHLLFLLGANFATGSPSFPIESLTFGYTQCFNNWEFQKTGSNPPTDGDNNYSGELRLRYTNTSVSLCGSSAIDQVIAEYTVSIEDI